MKILPLPKQGLRLQPESEFYLRQTILRQLLYRQKLDQHDAFQYQIREFTLSTHPMLSFDIARSQIRRISGKVVDRQCSHALIKQLNPLLLI